jgi:hypothetical protein
VAHTDDQPGAGIPGVGPLGRWRICGVIAPAPASAPLISHPLRRRRKSGACARVRAGARRSRHLFP